ncbi:DUF427 domain-containing protein [Cryobacterium sp. PH31-AA6]|uniref:DUF427 domain-containing protein n=1 Tax=Cryobacterium sp. PH31-AA6 TaxID=3046205 RepID=UPI0024B89E2A|nr:DUF427 domain-containing protein [Cryobacterium sp. PH31-AA6]MDJ0322700.1 DUF427 domain-containing protein [Cryobacterium sp. PH31-AA6]
MITASYHGTILAQSEVTIYLEGNHYFPRESVAPAILRKSWVRTLCYWKGIARYYHVAAEEQHLANAAWSYPLPSPLAWRIRDMVAFAPQHGIRINDDRA